MGLFKVPIKELCVISVANANLTDSDLADCIMQSMQNQIQIEGEKDNSFKIKLLRYFIPTFRRNWKSSFYRKDILETKFIEWLSTDFEVNLSTPNKICGKNKKDFESSSKSTKRRKVLDICDKYSEIEIQEAFIYNLKAKGRKKLATEIRELLNDPEKQEDEDNVIRYTEDEVLAVIEDAKLSKYQYEIIRLQAKQKNANIYIPYNNLKDAKKRCYPSPEALSITEKGVKIDLQALLDHTAQRLLLIPDIQTRITEDNLQSMTLILKYGCDGASGQSAYKQKLSDDMISDQSIFMASMVPIQLKSVSNQIWKNPNPGSTKLCIPLAFQYAKETPTLTRSVVEELKTEISRLKPTDVSFGEFRCQVHHKMLLTMIDAKVAQNLTETPSAATCYLCKANPSEMNDLKKIVQKPVIDEYCEYGMSTLHAKLGFMRNILNISYRKDFRKWQIKSEEEKEMSKAAKQRVQERFRKELGLIIDVPKPGAGNSDDGNTARKFFRDPELTSDITGVDVRLITQYSIILQVISCGQKVDLLKFEKYSSQTAKLYVQLYKWYPMPSTVHKILTHGKIIMEKFLVPIGVLSEEAQEARNKDFKRFREFNTRKCNRMVTNADLIHKLLLSSDPYLSHFRQKWKHNDSTLDLEALELLVTS